MVGGRGVRGRWRGVGVYSDLFIQQAQSSVFKAFRAFKIRHSAHVSSGCLSVRERECVCVREYMCVCVWISFLDEGIETREDGRNVRLGLRQVGFSL